MTNGVIRVRGISQYTIAAEEVGELGGRRTVSGVNGVSWRDLIKIHPAAELFPRMSDEELKALTEDIRKNGLRVPIVTWHDSDGQEWLLDGRNQMDALEQLGYRFSRIKLQESLPDELSIREPDSNRTLAVKHYRPQEPSYNGSGAFAPNTGISRLREQAEGVVIGLTDDPKVYNWLLGFFDLSKRQRLEALKILEAELALRTKGMPHDAFPRRFPRFGTAG